MANQYQLRSVFATERFIDDLATTLQTYSHVEVKVRDFILDKQSWPVGSSTRAKDYKLSGVLNETWHWHIVFGQAVLIYQIDPAEVRLYCVVPHSHVEDDNKQKALSRYIASVSQDALIPYTPVTVDVGLELDPETSRLVETTLYDCAASPEDRWQMEAASRGEFDYLHIFLHTMCDQETHKLADFVRAVDTAFEGRETLQQLVCKVLIEIPEQVREVD